MEKILVSACLLGEKVRYDGNDKKLCHSQLTQWLAEGRIISVCPEISGGLSVPRSPAEQVAQQVIDINGNNLTQAFNKGAEIALQIVKKQQIKYAVLKANSPSCGNEKIYDGSFSNVLINGQGVTAKLLTHHGVKVFNENQLQQLAQYLD